MKSEFKDLSAFHWQNGYGAFSISPSHLPQLTTYVANQEPCRRREAFQVEFRRCFESTALSLTSAMFGTDRPVEPFQGSL